MLILHVCCCYAFLWQVMEFEVKSLLDTVNSIHEEMYYLRDRYFSFSIVWYYEDIVYMTWLWCGLREEEMQDLNRSTNTKMAWLSVLSFFVCIGVAGMQFLHLKTFFEKKKVIWNSLLRGWLRSFCFLSPNNQSSLLLGVVH